MVISNCNVIKLHNEFIKQGVNPYPVFELGNGNGDFTFPNDTNMELVQQIIDAHNPTPVPIEPTEIELLQKENLLLKAQVQANADISDFHEELIVELAMMVYQ